ncbi:MULTISPECIES: methionine ABC transporter permease [unclassified Rhodococcus (in: high G+C Gram-positive bacteria)]|jgi:D-methionine transport system permease protein|uniref:methionine ABC transporter permease n=1 Tax=unclassified Rhodococcus (in: high G+C Gram-positive bacteria) TaxID=192944 RepID=UPI00146F0C39|nr:MULTISPECIES: methionine ABC transporter permease [unclassified Rhodococcus (in: high G+C Gram-positive bacteria)]MBF0662153.1 ABC transporter permease [Rhodococcus sp. (in: high G+C Gram-positive bacteria)]NME80749.1 ABC transporter permease [Rhodococcus sp. 105337]
MNKLTWYDSLPEVWEATLETLYMVTVSFVLTVIGGVLVGIVLQVTSPSGLLPRRTLNTVLGVIVNLFRSLPFLILLIALIGVTRAIVGTAIGPTAAIVPLTIGAIPFFARIVESALREVPRGRVEAAQAMGASTGQIVRKVLLPEAVSPLVAGATLTLVLLVGYSAMAGVIGGGGLGDFAIVYGYQRFNTPVLLVAVVVLIVMVQIMQSVGDGIIRAYAHRR